MDRGPVHELALVERRRTLMRRIARKVAQQCDYFLFWCTSNPRRAVASFVCYVTLLVLSLILFPVWRLIYFVATAMFALWVIAPVAVNFRRLKKPKRTG